MTDASETIGFGDPPEAAPEVLEREQRTCEKHGVAFERRLQRMPPRLVLGRRFEYRPSWVGECARCREEAVQAQFERESAERARQT